MQKFTMTLQSLDFNPLPRKEGDCIHRAVNDDGVYFNPLPRKEGDVLIQMETRQKQIISIHSLVKRETYLAQPKTM